MEITWRVSSGGRGKWQKGGKGFCSAICSYMYVYPYVAIHISSLASPFPMLFLTSLCLFCTYQLYFLFPVPFPHSLLPLPADNLHVIPISVILFLFQLFAQFVFVLGSIVDSCEFVVILLFIFLIIFFFLDKSLTFHVIRAW